MRNVREVVGLAVVAAVGSNALTALLGAGVVTLAFGAPFPAAWLTWWIADGAAMLVVVPLIVTARQGSRGRWTWFRVTESMALQGTVAALSIAILLAPETSLRPFPAFLILAWAAVRFGPGGTSLILAEIAALAVIGTVSGVGPFSTPDDHSQAVLQAQAFVAILFGSGFLVAAAVQQHDDARSELEGERRSAVDRAERLDRVNRFARDIGASLDPDEFHQRLVQAAALAVAADVVRLVTVNGDGDFTIRAAVGAPDEIGRALDARDGLVWQAIEAAGVRVGTSAQAGEVELSAPLVRDGSVVAALALTRRAEHPFAIDEQQTVGMLAELGALALGNVNDHAAANERSVRDALTGLPNRYYFDLVVAQLGAQRERQPADAREPVAVVFFDLDHFGTVNKERGHATGDRVLAAFGALLATRLRRADVVARYGGEEFVAILPGTSREGAVAVANEILSTFAARTIEGSDGAPVRATSSAGAAQVEVSEGAMHAALTRADMALAVAKRAGRNQVQAA